MCDIFNRVLPRPAETPGVDLVGSAKTTGIGVFVNVVQVDPLKRKVGILTIWHGRRVIAVWWRRDEQIVEIWCRFQFGGIPEPNGDVSPVVSIRGQVSAFPEGLGLTMKTLVDVGNHCGERLQRVRRSRIQIVRTANVQLERGGSRVARQPHRFRETCPEHATAPSVINPSDGSPDAREFIDDCGAKPLSQPWKVSLDPSVAIRPGLFDDLLDDPREFAGVERTRFRPAEQYGERIYVLPRVVQPQTHALDQGRTGTGERVEYPTDTPVHIRHGSDEHRLHRRNHHRRILSQSLCLLPRGAAPKRPVVFVRFRQAFQFADNFCVG